MAWTFSFRVLTGVAGGLLLVGVAPLLESIYPYPQFRLFVWLCAPTVLFSMLHQLSLVVLRARRFFGVFLTLDFYGALLQTALSIALSYGYGLWGYACARLIGEAARAGAALLAVRSFCPLSSSFSLTLGNRSAWRRLRSLALFMYPLKLSSIPWLRLPFLIAAASLSPAAVGALAVAIRFGSRLQLINGAVSSLVAPRLTHILRDSPSRFLLSAKRELFQVVLLNVLGIGGLYLLWHVAGAAFVGTDRYRSVGLLLHAVAAVYFLGAVYGAMAICMLIPAKLHTGLTTHVVIANCLAPLVLVLLWRSVGSRAWFVPASMAISPVMIILMFAQRIRRSLQVSLSHEWSGAQ